MSVGIKLQSLADAQERVHPCYHFTVEQYHRMIEAGILTENDPVELLEGWIIEKMPRNPPHDGTIARINRRLSRVLPEEWVLRVQSAVTLRNSEPEPDFAIVRGPEETYFQRHPFARDVGLLIEVADSTLLFDRQTKGQIYAAARIAQFWIINLVEAAIETYSQPRAGRVPTFRMRRNYAPADDLPLFLDGLEVARFAVRDLLP